MSKKSQEPIFKAPHFSLYERDEVDTFYADGVAQAMVGPIISKIGFYQVTNVTQTSPTSPADPSRPQNSEDREIMRYLTVPTRQITEFCVMFLRQVSESGSVLGNAIDGEKEQLQKLIKSFTLPPK